MKIKIKSNVDSYTADFKQMINEIDKQEVLEEVGFYLENEMRKRFSSGTDMDGKAWAKLKYRSGKPLRDTGRLMGSLGTAEINGNSVSVFSNLIYAGIHDRGGTITPKSAKMLAFKVGGKSYFAKSVTIPQRKFSGISSKNKKELKKIIKDYYTKKLNG